ncbi:MAG: LytR C-terminal domain-containing protein [Dermatophilaceae bacterium]|nr:LytR C-terminal domain-containing protein [Dermatophilaceae bacterium]
MDYLQESGVSIYRRRRRRRAVITLSFVSLMLIATIAYAASYVQGWVGTPKTTSVANANCSSEPTLTPAGVTVNVYNASARTGLAASVARALDDKGFRVATVDNDPLGKTILTVGEIRAGPSGAAAAALISKRLVGATVVRDDRPDASVDLVLGKRYRALNTPPKVKVKVTVTKGISSPRGAEPASCSAEDAQLKTLS